MAVFRMEDVLLGETLLGAIEAYTERMKKEHLECRGNGCEIRDMAEDIDKVMSELITKLKIQKYG